MAGLRERKTMLTRQTIALAAWTLFQQRPASTVTVREIAELADLSERSVHNYFPVRGDLVVAALDVGAPGAEYVALLEDRPDHEHPATAFRRAMSVVCEPLTDADARSVRAVLSAIRQDPDLHAAQLRRTACRVELLARHMRHRAARHGLDEVELAVLYTQCFGAIDVIADHQPDRPSVSSWVAQIDAALARIESGWVA